MPTIEISKKPLIYDDTEKCGSCAYVSWSEEDENYICDLFKDDLGSKTIIWYYSEIDGCKKHNECKAEYQKAKNSTIKCKICGNELGFNGSHYYHKNHSMIHSAIPDRELPEGHRLG